jgi:outer membrane protein OmpA-like peptidoglycan-associated protein
MINTPFDEEAPFIHPDGTTLYYSSNGKQKVGHYDIYLTRLNGNVWSEPKVVSFPIDTTKDIESTEEPIPKQIVIQKKKKRSKKAVVEKEKVNETRDNYLISFSNPYGEPLTLVKGEFVVKEGKEAGNVKIVVRNNDNKEMNGLYYTENNSNKYSIVLPPSKNNNIAYNKDGYVIFSENIDLTEKKDLFVKRLPLELHVPEQGASIVLNNLFFENDHSVLRPTSEVALNDLYSFLNDHKNLVVEFNSLIVAKEDIRKKSKLSQERADAIVKYLIDKGISKDKLIAKGDAVKSKRAKDKKPGHFLELKIVDYLPEKELTTQ